MEALRERKKLILAVLLAAALALVFSGCSDDETKKTRIVYSKEEHAQAEETLAGDWYGWWSMKDAKGDWEGMAGYWWDCCAELSKTGETYTLLIWDEDLPKDNYLAKLNLTYTDGVLSVKSGELMSMAVTGEDCTLRLIQEEGTILRLTGRYYYKGIGSFSFSMRMIPWGELWPDGEDELPYYYDSWYLPLINENKPMPDKIG